ncbi:MAG: Gfo/Idh/MocA family oxidoreductase [Nitrospirae bacterium]|nr:Gfo/Idh/MocA family oxidoreductase [Nitrospirota bacterium]
MKKIKVGVVGVGRLGKEHARLYSLLPDVDLTGVVDIDHRRAQEVAVQCQTVGYRDYKELYERVEAISIAVPTDLHFPIARDFLKRGIHLLLEKPITRTTEEAEELIKLADRDKLVFQVGHIERYNAAIREVEGLVDSPRFIESHRLAPYQPRGTEVGVVLDLMIHDLDIILHLVDSPLKRIEAVGVAVLSQHEDIANVRLLFQNGCVANVTSSRLSREKMRKLRIFQSDSYISLDFLTQKIDLYREKEGTISGEKISPPKLEPLGLEIKDFVECVVKKRSPLVSGEEGKEVLKVALEIERQIYNQTLAHRH